ncbi:hypothetical protein [Stakelama tenebrarum]|uniref:Uncharacterized protein n=1 Tax=Stakelama tenebrarum TaxID=2711215 RepID=A0A6G6Y722_9SPHN|nr:hypothetical protein [Sphingosinithalassobacter tenebrarum]QIG80508.1 hypothetical protein G5C33_12435 [Sphingosinithalassobacter tenebrarum]
MERLVHNPENAASTYRASIQEASCVVNISGDRSADLIGGELTDDPRFRDLTRAMSQRYSACVRDPSGRVMPIMLSGAIAEQLLLEQPAESFEDRASSVNVNDAEAFHGNLAEGVTMAKIAACVAVYSPGLVRKVLDTEVGSATEGEALDAAYRATPECGLPARPASIPEAFQRGALAEALLLWRERSE